MKDILGKEWEVTPAGGATGEAFVATFGNEKIFIKRNSSPFLAVLSAEGIVPKLLWTKRLENGDVITAQKWLDGRELKAHEMQTRPVASLLSKIHSSKALLSMLKRLGKEELGPINILEEISESVASLPFHIRAILQAPIQYLSNELKHLDAAELVVCHGDLNHNNWLVAEENEDLYLIDWDGAVIADPAFDLGMLLTWYVPEENWENWLSLYGIELDDSLIKRMNWYVIAQTIQSLIWHYQKENNKEISVLQNFIGRFRDMWQMSQKFELFPGN